MNKLIAMILVILIVSIAASCSAPPASENNEIPEAPPQNVQEPAAPRDELQERAEEILGKMTIEEKLGQLLVVGFPKDTTDEVIADYIEKYKVSGFILFSRNYSSFDAQYSLVEGLKARNSLKNPLPLFIAIDEEGGTVSRLPKGGTHFPDAKLVGKAGDPELTAKTGEVIGQELKAAGINLDFAPVLDIVESSENKLLIRRSYGSSPETVISHGTAFINGLQASGVIASPKHFPGHGATTVDSHGKLPVINIDMDTFKNRELLPFKAVIDQGLDIIMAGHLAYPQLDPSGLPATRSRYFLTEILRKQLNFNGIAISDDIEMGGYTSGSLTLEEGAVESFNAGLDIFLIGSSKEVQDRVLSALAAACGDGRITEERLDESVLRIIKVKLKHKLSDEMEYSLEGARKNFGSQEHKAVLEELNTAIQK